MSEYFVNESVASIKVVGVGGAGGNAINDMIEGGILGVEFIVANTDSQDLLNSKAPTKLQLGEKLTKGLGAGANPEIGKQAAEEEKEKVRTLLEGTDLLFITAGMGGGTGTGGAPVIAGIAKDMGILTIAVVTKPFKFEGRKRTNNAEEGIEELKNSVDTLVVIPNEKLFELPDKKITLKNAFLEANNILRIGIKGIAELITTQGFMNLDFADVRTIMNDSGMAMLGFGEAAGEERAERAAEQALSSPLLEKSIKGARRILLNITGGEDMQLAEANKIAGIITDEAGDASEVIFGSVIDETMEEGIRITVIATDFEEKNEYDITRREPITTMYRERVVNEDELDIPSFIRRKK